MFGVFLAEDMGVILCGQYGLLTVLHGLEQVYQLRVAGLVGQLLVQELLSQVGDAGVQHRGLRPALLGVQLHLINLVLVELIYLIHVLHLLLAGRVVSAGVFLVGGG